MRPALLCHSSSPHRQLRNRQQVQQQQLSLLADVALGPNRNCDELLAFGHEHQLMLPQSTH